VNSSDVHSTWTLVGHNNYWLFCDSLLLTGHSVTNQTCTHAIEALQHWPYRGGLLINKPRRSEPSSINNSVDQHYTTRGHAFTIFFVVITSSSSCFFKMIDASQKKETARVRGGVSVSRSVKTSRSSRTINPPRHISGRF
jgi:hypothetical protein